MDADQLLFWKSKTKSHIILLKKKYGRRLKAFYEYTKTTILLAAHKKQQLL